MDHQGCTTTSTSARLRYDRVCLVALKNSFAKQTTFAGKTILQGYQTNSIVSKPGAGAGGGAAPADGDPQTMTLQVGSNKGDTITFQLGNMMFSKVGEAAKIQGGNNIDTIIKDGTTAFGKATGDAITVNFSVAGAAENIIGFMDQMIGYVDSQRADLGRSRTVLRALSATSLTLLLMKLMPAHVFVMLTLQKSLLTSHSSPSFSKQLLPC